MTEHQRTALAVRELMAALRENPPKEGMLFVDGEIRITIETGVNR